MSLDGEITAIVRRAVRAELKAVLGALPGTRLDGVADRRGVLSPPEKRVYTVRDVAAALQVSYEQAHALCLSGEIRFVRAGRYIRIPRERLDAYLAGGGIRSDLAANDLLGERGIVTLQAGGDSGGVTCCLRIMSGTLFRGASHGRGCRDVRPVTPPTWSANLTW